MLPLITLLYITFPSQEKAQEMSNHLLTKKLVACTNAFPVTSSYWWQGKIENEGEIGLLAKTIPTLEDKVRAEIKGNHPYQTPLIVSW